MSLNNWGKQISFLKFSMLSHGHFDHHYEWPFSKLFIWGKALLAASNRDLEVQLLNSTDLLYVYCSSEIHYPNAVLFQSLPKSRTSPLGVSFLESPKSAASAYRNLRVYLKMVNHLHLLWEEKMVICAHALLSKLCDSFKFLYYKSLSQECWGEQELSSG